MSATQAATASSALSPTTTTAPPLFGSRTASPSASSTSGSSGSTSPYFGSSLGGTSPPSIYLICFVVIICLLLAISLFVATRALLLRRRLHQAWAATGYSDTFFENNPTIAAMHGVQGWGASGWGANQVRKRERKLGKRPTMWEVELPEEGVSRQSEKEALFEGTSAAAAAQGLSADWAKVQPISVRIISDRSSAPAAEPVQPARPPPTPPSFLQTLRGPPVRPPQQPAFFAAAASTPVALGPEQSIEALESERGTLELSVLVRLPVAPAELDEREARRRERSATLVAGEELLDDDEGEDLPELWIATERVDLL